MEESLLCPICETQNAPDATHCEVCGERLVPAEPGEDVSPEESVADQLSSSDGEVVGFSVDEPDEAPADATAEGMPITDFESEGEAEGGDDFEAIDLESDELDAGAPELVDETGAIDNTDEGITAAPADATAEMGEMELPPVEDEALPDRDPDVLYSPHDGTAYPRGSAEYEEGFGPMGEELVAEPPEDVTGGPPTDASSSEVSEVSGEGGFDDEYDEYDFEELSEGVSDDEPVAEAGGAPSEPASREPSPEFRSAFQARQKERPKMEPLPEPGTYVEPATLTVYVNREPVMRHEIESDETLIGRRDPVADAYPDVDLSDYDPEAHVSRKHAYIYRQNKNYTLYAVSNAGTQLNDTLLELGDRHRLEDDDVIVLAGKVAMKFDLPGE